MWFYYLVMVLVMVIFGGLYLYWRRVSQYWAKRNVPYLPPHPILGSLTFLQRQNPAVWLRQIYRRMNAPYHGLWLLWRPALMVNSPELARRVLVKDSDNFRNRFLRSGRSDPIGRLNLFISDDPIWTYMRKRLSPVFTPARLKTVHSVMIEKGEQLVQRIRNEIESGKQINLRAMYADYTTDVIGTAAFGVVSEATITGKSHLRDVTNDFMKYSTFRGLGWASIYFCPEMVDVFRFSLFPKSTTEYFRRILRAVVKQRQNDPSREQKDLLDTLIHIREEATNNNIDVSEDMLVSQAAMFLQGGFDTTGVALTFLTYEMAHNMEAQKKLHEELVEAKDKYSQEEYDSIILSDGLPYMNCVINETLRMYPAMGWIDRVAANDYKIDEKLTISAGTPVYVNSVGMHYDPKYYVEPEKFMPERFLPSNESGIEPFTFLPFGDGPRSCIGQRFAYRTMRCAVSAIFLNFALEPHPNSPKPSECEMEKKGILIMPGQIMSVAFVPRNRT